MTKFTTGVTSDGSPSQGGVTVNRPIGLAVPLPVLITVTVRTNSQRVSICFVAAPCGGN